MSDPNSQDSERLEFESAVFDQYQILSRTKKNLDDIRSGEGIGPKPKSDERWPTWIMRNVVNVPLEVFVEYAHGAQERLPDNLKRQKEAEELLANAQYRERFCFHISQLSNDGLLPAEWEIQNIKAVMRVLVDENPSGKDTTGIDARVIARVVFKLLHDGDYCK